MMRNAILAIVSIAVLPGELAAERSNHQFDHQREQSDHPSPYKAVELMEVNPDFKSFHAELYAEATYWYGKSQQGVFADISNADQNPVAPRIGLPIVKTTPRFGFKVGAGKYFCWSQSELTSEYTWFYNRQDRDKYIWYTLSGTDTFVGETQKAGGSFSNIFNSVDLLVRKKYYFGDVFRLQPCGGLLGNWGSQWFSAETQDTVSGGSTIHHHNTLHIWGIGPYVGLNSAFFLPKMQKVLSQFGLFFEWGGALSYMRPNLSGEYYINGAVRTKTRRREHQLTPMLKNSLGIIWEMKEEYSRPWTFSLYAKWDNQAWLGYSDIFGKISGGVNIGDSASGYDYTMQGVSGGLNFSF